MADLRKHVKRAAEQVDRLPRHMGGKTVEPPKCSCWPYVRTMGFHHPRCDRKGVSRG